MEQEATDDSWGPRRALGYALGALTGTINTLALTVSYLLGLGSTALAARLVGKRFLELGPDASAPSYWEPADQGNAPRDRYYRQY
ncbi:MAG: hypothetical protein QF415_06505 [Candidatus Undinarchaeales archaeon]|nr:hypothetical protein [Candidatus Undinarchaeales archaeon]MDP7491607.1 hypothetical protein [Candidatus Undinarchaeales archaeon]